MKNNKSAKRVVDILLKISFILYLVILFRITVFRAGFSFENLLKNGTINITLFQGYIPILEGGNWFRFIYLFVGNIIWFVPFGAYLQFRQHQRKVEKIGAIVLLGFFLSLIIESLQYVFGTGYSEIDDLILNTLGALIGALLCKRISTILPLQKR